MKLVLSAEEANGLQLYPKVVNYTWLGGCSRYISNLAAEIPGLQQASNKYHTGAVLAPGSDILDPSYYSSALRLSMSPVLSDAVLDNKQIKTWASEGRVFQQRVGDKPGYLPLEMVPEEYNDFAVKIARDRFKRLHTHHMYVKGVNYPDLAAEIETGYYRKFGTIETCNEYSSMRLYDEEERAKFVQGVKRLLRTAHPEKTDEVQEFCCFLTDFTRKVGNGGDESSGGGDSGVEESSGDGSGGSGLEAGGDGGSGGNGGGTGDQSYYESPIRLSALPAYSSRRLDPNHQMKIWIQDGIVYQQRVGDKKYKPLEMRPEADGDFDARTARRCCRRQNHYIETKGAEYPGIVAEVVIHNSSKFGTISFLSGSDEGRDINLKLTEPENRVVFTENVKDFLSTAGRAGPTS
ncbi:hypothetical protein TWF696_006191 [Orbilia brochopaga]|uniref:Uncharacterized protein n=1 Tax=Orbilia brochopaga TaxID=3140254 RepID=A0AAV9UVL6_9PEZI